MISSPVPVSGRAHVFEGTVTVRVLDDRKGTPTEIGSGFVTGGGDQLGPFNGEITFNQPDGGSGWIIFTEQSAANGEPIRATSVQVGYVGRAAPPLR
jgi:immunoglobulin-like protein involved in spore germination